MQTLWMNVYRSGWFHRTGKPNTIDAHAGDFYESQQQALADIDWSGEYLATVPFQWNGKPLHANSADSESVPLSVTRKQRMLQSV